MSCPQCECSAYRITIGGGSALSGLPSRTVFEGAAPSPTLEALPTQSSPTSLNLKSIAPSDLFHFPPHSILHRNHRPRLKLKSRQHRAKLVHRHRVIALHQHMPAPLAHALHKHFDLEINRRLQLRENFEHPLPQLPFPPYRRRLCRLL